MGNYNSGGQKRRDDLISFEDLPVVDLLQLIRELKGDKPLQENMGEQIQKSFLDNYHQSVGVLEVPRIFNGVPSPFYAFACPTCSRRCRKLWLHYGSWHCCQCLKQNNVRYNSQRTGIYDRCTRIMLKILRRMYSETDLRRVGYSDEGICQAFEYRIPGKPKWMRHRTYIKLYELWRFNVKPHVATLVTMDRVRRND